MAPDAVLFPPPPPRGVPDLVDRSSSKLLFVCAYEFVSSSSEYSAIVLMLRLLAADADDPAVSPRATAASKARALRSILSLRRRSSSLLPCPSPCLYSTSTSVAQSISSARCFLVMSCSTMRSKAWTMATSSLNIIDSASDSTTTAAPILHGPPSTGRNSMSNPDGARRMISSLRSRDRTASHSSFFSHNSRRDLADAPAWAAAAAAADALLLDGSLGLADDDAGSLDG